MSTMYVALDGSYGEGGGQILRNSISYATLLCIPLQIHKIRAGRSQPGLKAQHIASLRLPCQLVTTTTTTTTTNGQHGIKSSLLEGDTLRSTSIAYTPPTTTTTPKDKTAEAAHVERHVSMEIGTAGSICLLLQAALPVALFGATPARLTLGGGTNASMAPQYDYWHKVFLPTLTSQCGLAPHAVTAQVIRRGYFPKGGGQVLVTVSKPLTTSQTLRPVQLTERGEPVALRIRASHAGHQWTRPQAVQMARAARDFLQQHQPNLLIDVSEEIVTEQHAVGNGMGILLITKTSTGCLLAGSALWDKKLDTPAKVGTAAAQELAQTWMDGGCVDEWLQDNLILYMALAEGTSRMITGSLTLHTETAIWVAEQLTEARFSVQRLEETTTEEEKTNNSHPSKRQKAESCGDSNQ
eukprot:scaffold16508_cov133-Amphora_coffeaeformis.AAC.3